MAFTPSIGLLFLIAVIYSIVTEAKRGASVGVHEGQCPSNELLRVIRCRRRVCLPEELIPLCENDADCATTHKCCRPMCSCRDQCVRSSS